MLEEKEQRIAAYLAKVARGQPFTYSYNLSNGRAIRVSAGPTSDDGWVDAHEDITHELSLESRVAHMALHDGLTDLANRTLLQQRGHSVGDALLRTVAERLRSCVRRFSASPPS